MGMEAILKERDVELEKKCHNIKTPMHSSIGSGVKGPNLINHDLPHGTITSSEVLLRFIKIFLSSNKFLVQNNCVIYCSRH